MPGNVSFLASSLFIRISSVFPNPLPENRIGQCLSPRPACHVNSNLPFARLRIEKCLWHLTDSIIVKLPCLLLYRIPLHPTESCINKKTPPKKEDARKPEVSWL